MATKDHLQLSLGQSGHFNVNSVSNQNGQYNNLNLNANQTFPILETIQYKSISSNSNKNNNYAESIETGKTVNHNKLSSSSWKNNGGGIWSNGSNMPGSFGSNKTSKNDKTSTTTSNSSTLSLHIAAYENSIEAPVGLNSAENDEIGSKQKRCNKTSKNVKTFSAATLLGCFEIPRQQSEGAPTSEPEIMQFKASQKLLNPNKQDKSDDGISIGHEVETKKNNYVIVRDIMKGRMSKVFEVRRSRDGKILAMKSHKPTDNNEKTMILRHEAHIYHELSVLARNLPKDEIRFLNLYDYGECSDGQFLFLTLGGEPLANFLSNVKVPNYQTALDLSFQMLNAIEQIHTLGLIHCRIRPQTFITGLKPRERYMLFIINFSLARMANPTRTETINNRIPPQIFDRYAPRCQHFGAPYHRRDDLESWFYICCDLFHPHFLPWSPEKRLKSPQMAELKDKLMKGELYYRYSVMPKPFQAIAGAINETDAKMPNYSFLKECLMEEAKSKNCSFYSPWEFIPVASLPPVPDAQTQTRIEYEFNQCIKNPTTFNFGTEKSRTVIPDDGSQQTSELSTDVQVVLPTPKSKTSVNASTPDSDTKSNTPGTKDSESSNLAAAASAITAESDTKPIAPDAKPPVTAQEDSSEDEDDGDDEEEEFKLKSPPKPSGAIPALSPTPQANKKRSSSKDSKPVALAAASSSGSDTSVTSSSGSGVTTPPTISTSEATSGGSATSSGSTLSTNSTTTTGSDKKQSASSSSGSSQLPLATPPKPAVKVVKATSTASASPKGDTRQKKIVASTPASLQSASPVPAVSPKGATSPATSACSTASLPNYAKVPQQQTPQKADSIDYNSSNPAPNNNNDVQNASNYPKLSSSQVRTFQNHKNDSVYFGVPADAATTPPANTSGYLKPSHDGGGAEATTTTPKMQQDSPSKSSAKNESVYFAPK